MNHNTKNLARTHCLGKQQQPNPPRQYYFFNLMIICLLSFATTPVYSATYHLNNLSAPGGDGTNAALTGANAAFDTISACQAVLEALGDNGSGDTVIVYEGDGTTYGGYEEEEAQARTDWLTFRANTDENPVWTHIYIQDFDGSGNPFDQYLVIDGITFKFDGSKSFCVRVNLARQLKFLNLTLIGQGYKYNHGDATDSYGLHFSSCSDVEIVRCSISGIGDSLLTSWPGMVPATEAPPGVTAADFGKGFTRGIYSYPAPTSGAGQWLVDGNDLAQCHLPLMLDGVINSIISNNTIHHYTDDGINIIRACENTGSNETVISGNHIYAGYSFEGTLDGEPTGVGGHNDGIQLQGMDGVTWQNYVNIVIKENQIHDIMDQAMWLNVGEGSDSWLIENNLIYKCPALNTSTARILIAGPTGMRIRNNTIIANGNNNSTGFDIKNQVNQTGRNAEILSFTGNIIERLNINLDTDVVTMLEENNNIINTAWLSMSTWTPGTETIFINKPYNDLDTFKALFTDYDNDDFSLAAGSSAINFGNAGKDPSTDIIGVTRDADHYSAGAYEFTGPALDSIGDKDIDEGEELAFSISAHDINGDPITYSATGTAITAGGVLTGPNFAWTPNGSQAGTYQVTFTATAGGQTDFETITITVNNIINTAPILASIGSKSGSEGLLIGFTTSASDSDFPANDLTFSLEGTPPTGASIDAVTGYFTWVPTEAQGPGTYNVTVRVTDDGTGNLYDEEVVAITVGEVNTPPTLDVSDFDDDEPVDELEELTFTATATDTDVPSNTLTYSLINAPAGASIGSSSGIFTWTPTEAQGPGSYNATVRVTDNGTGSLYDEETINISVTETNTTPVLDPIGNKATNVGSQLTFTADATDTDVPANTLTYSLTTAPAGASIGSETGVFTWTPSSGYEQTFNVTVRVTDDGAGNLFDEEAITITVGPDVTDPTVTNLSPADADVQVSIDSLIILTIADAGIGVDLDTVTIDVEGDRIYDGGSETSEGVYESTGNAQTVKGICRRTGTSAAYSFFFQADARFDYEKNITVTVNASDLASTSNDMAEQSYSFYTVMREFEGNIKVNSDTGTLVQDRPAVAKDSDGNIWTVWYQTTIAGDTDIYIGKLAANDSVFGESTQVTSDTNNQRNAVIAIDSNNKMYLAWQDFRQGEWDIYLTTSTDGVTFSTETRITDPNSNQINPDMAIDSSDKVYIVWEDDQNSNNDIYIASSTNSFASKTTSQITSNASGQGSPAIAIDSAKTVYVVWTDARNASNDIYGATSTSGPWTNAAIVNNANGQSSPVIATETSGTVLHLLWVDDTSGNNDIFYGATTGGLAGLPLTGTDISDDTTSSDQSNPSIFATGTTGSDLRVFACWKDSRDVLNNNGDTDIYYGETALGGSTFGTNVLVNDDSGTNTQSVPVVNVDINGNPYLAWVDNRGGNKDIYYAGAMLMGSVLVTSPLITVGTGGTVEVDDTTSNIDSATDVRVVIPAGTLPADTTITISEMINPPSPPSGGFGVNYEFGPSGLVFNSPVAIYLPHAAADCPGHAIYRAYWYNQELSAWYPPGGIAAQHGVDPVSGVHYITFETDHFTGFGVGGGSAGGGGGGGGGGCSMSPDGQGTIVEFLVPYIGLAIVMAIMKLKGRRKKNLHRYTGSD